MCGYLNKIKNVYELNIPMDIATIIIKYYALFEFSKKLSHPKLLIEDNIIENVNSTMSWLCAYDSEEYDKGKYEWTVQILKETANNIDYNHWTIGMVKSSKIDGMYGYYASRGDDSGIGYNSNGDVYYGHSDYAPRYGVGDKITTIVDFDTLSMSFRLNGKDLGQVKKQLSKDIKYRFVVTSYCPGDTFRIFDV